MLDTKGKSKIVIVDDNPQNIKVLSKILQDKKEYEIFAVDSGFKLFDLSKKITFDLILLDVMMPQMDGFEVCKRLKSDESTKEIPIIFITAKADVDSVVEGFHLGASDYVSKPFNAKVLLSRVNTHLENKLLKDRLIEDNKIKEQMLFQESKMAQMGEMNDLVAHQWKQPISNIDMCRMSIEFFMENPCEDSQKTIKYSLDGIKQQVQHATSTLKEFRDFFKPNQKLQSISLSEIISSVSVLIQDQLKSNKIALEVDCKKDVQIYVSPNEIKHILINLIGNAKDAFNSKGEDIKRVVNCKVYETDSSAVLEVSDNAGGIPKNLIDDIFKAHFTTKGDQGGTGKGLYMSKLIANKYNGDISVKNQGDGAVFTINFVK